MQFQILTYLLLALVSNPAGAVTTPDPVGAVEIKNEAFEDEMQSSKMINEGNYQIGGNLGLGYSTLTGISFSAQPKLQYFIKDRVSVGGALDLFGNSDYTLFGIGPSASYYFWEQGEWAAFVSQTLIISSTLKNDFSDHQDNTRILGTSSVGLNYFFVANVAAGVTGNLHYVLIGDNYINYSVLQAAFQIYF